MLNVLDADIDECFGSLDHGVILGLLRERVQDVVLLRLIESWLRVGAGHSPGRDADLARGIPLGGVLSPLLCNLTLHELDMALMRAGYHPVRYADDFVVLCESEAEARQAGQVSAETLARLHLCLEPRKTAVTHFEQGFDYLGVHFERDFYRYVWANKRITVEGDFPDFLFAYGPEYE